MRSIDFEKIFDTSVTNRIDTIKSIKETQNHRIKESVG